MKNLRIICRLGGIAALLTFLTAFAEVVITFLPGGSVIPDTVPGWYTHLQDNWFMGLRNLGLLNIIMVSLGIPMYLSLYVVHSKADNERAALAVLLSLIGAAVFLATNRAFSMLELSHQYSLAATEAQRLMIESAGKAMLVVGRSHSPGTFIGFAFGELAGVGMSIVMLRNKLFGKKTAVTGILGFSFLLLFEIYSLFTPTMTALSMMLALLGGLLNIVWLLLVGISFLRIPSRKVKEV